MCLRYILTFQRLLWSRGEERGRQWGCHGQRRQEWQGLNHKLSPVQCLRLRVSWQSLPWRGGRACWQWSVKQVIFKMLKYFWNRQISTGRQFRVARIILSPDMTPFSHQQLFPTFLLINLIMTQNYFRTIEALTITEYEGSPRRYGPTKPGSKQSHAKQYNRHQPDPNKGIFRKYIKTFNLNYICVLFVRCWNGEQKSKRWREQIKGNYKIMLTWWLVKVRFDFPNLVVGKQE